MLEATDGSLWLLVATGITNDGNVVGDARRWARELVRQCYIKRSDEAFETPSPGSYICWMAGLSKSAPSLYGLAFYCWGLSTLQTLPPNYIRI